MSKNILTYSVIKNTIKELEIIGESLLINELLDVLNNCELEKPERHNKKDDIGTSYFKIELSNDSVERIIEILELLFLNSIDANGEVTAKGIFYEDLLVEWNSI